MNFTFEKEKTALLVMEYQTVVVGMVSPGNEAGLENMVRALDAARYAGVKVIYVVIGFRPDYPEVSPRNRSFVALRESKLFAPGNPGTEVHPAVAPRPGDLSVTKHRFSAFSGSDLDMLLRAGGYETLVLAGISTSGVVLSTLRQAADLDFRLAVLKDACMDMDPEVHGVLMDKVFPRQAEVMSTQDFVGSLGS